ncbi:universal stress protein [Winogradskyella tangerina]|uniref:universal stress protein n=1 Tax=Winogradskyella tangerina TaxID=2023240 RepID=UPI000DBE299A|nr:universal stress protein [Winogradskyella tangerina]
MKNILLPIDFKGSEQLLLDKAYEIAEKFKSKVWLIHVAAPDPDYIGYDAGPQSIRDSRAEELREEHKQIQTYARSLTQKGIETDALLIQGTTVDTLLEKTEALNIDLMVIGRQSHGLFYKAIFGSVADSLVKKTSIPILIVPLD